MFFFVIISNITVTLYKSRFITMCEMDFKKNRLGLAA